MAIILQTRNAENEFDTIARFDRPVSKEEALATAIQATIGSKRRIQGSRQYGRPGLVSLVKDAKRTRGLGK